MDDAEAVIAAAENYVRRTLTRAFLPRPGECLACYLHRAVAAVGCDSKLTLTHQWQGSQRLLRRRTGGLTAFVRSRGGYCDCEVLLNVYPGRSLDDAMRPGPCRHGPQW